MTLLTGTRSPKQVVVSADGLCVSTQGSERHTSCLDLQKIFPLEHGTVAIAHHGENKISDTPVETLIRPLLSSDPTTPISRLVESLVQKLDSPIRSTLSEICDAQKCAFWVCGFTQGTTAPTIIEIEWKKTETSIEFEQTDAGDLFMSGDGHQFVAKYRSDPIDAQFSWNKLWSANEEYHLRFHEKLWRIAEKRQTAENKQLFGGHKHVVVLTPKQWRWAAPPRFSGFAWTASWPPPGNRDPTRSAARARSSA